MGLRFGEEICQDLEQALRREWLETNGLGGFASSTITGANTRRYHGLLVAATKPPVGRMVLLSKLEETVVVDDRRHELSSNCYPGVVHPRGHERLQEFRLDPFPVFTYRVEDCEVEKSVFLVQGENTVVIEYRLQGPEGQRVSLEVRPLIAFRDYHATTHENGALDSQVDMEAGLATVAPYAGLPALHIAHNASAVTAEGDWYRNFEYAVERERGLDYLEDLFSPFSARFDLVPGESAIVIASTEFRSAVQAAGLREEEVQRRKASSAVICCDDPLVRRLAAPTNSLSGAGNGTR